MRKLTLLFLIVLFAAIITAPITAQAQEAISASYDTDVEFPTTLTFSINAESNADITQIILRYKMDKITTVTLISEVELEVTPASTIDTNWKWDAQNASLPPGAEIQYSWRIEDAAGHELETPWEAIRFEDNRYDWRSLTEEKISLFWYKGDQSLAHELIDAANRTLDKLGHETGAYLEQSVEIYIYASQEDLLSALVFPQEWTGGISFSEYGILAIALTQDMDWVKGTIAHELAHLVTYQMTYNPYSDIPTWLNEGLSMYAEGDLDPSFQYLLDRAISKDQLISVQTLSSNFPTDVTEVRLSYAESYSLVEFLIRNYGQEKMLTLLGTFKDGSTYDDALEEVYGLDTTGLDNLWRQSLGLGPRQGTPTPRPTSSNGFWDCHEASAKTAQDSTAGLSALSIFLLPVIGEVIRVRARRGKR